MIAHVVKSVIGCFAFDDSGSIIYYRLFPSKPSEIIGLMKKPIPEDFMKELGCEAVEDDFARGIISQRLREYALSLGFAADDRAFNKFLSDYAILLCKESSKKEMTKDKFIVQASNALKDMEKQSNLFIERLKEWYGLHYPELRANNEQYASLVAEQGLRENMPGYKRSTGLEIDGKDEEMIKRYASMVHTSFEAKKALEAYIKKSMQEICPNISSLIDPVLAARLLAHTGSLERLSRMSSSAIQLLGAEKALFRHLKNKKKVKPPKYGIIFTSSYIQNAPVHKQGKVARVLSAKLMIAAKIDFYSGRFEEKLSKDLRAEIDAIMKESLKKVNR